MILFLDILATMFIIALGVIGYKRGLVEELGRLLGLIIAISFAWSYYVELSGIILNIIFNINPWVVMVFSFTIIFIAVLLLARILTKFIHLLLLSKSTKLVNRTMGFVFGSLKAVLIVMVFIWALDISQKKEWSNIIHTESSIAEFMTSARLKIIHSFYLQDPVTKGEEFVQELMESAEEDL
jgi:membrane protein required for colicin V production